VVANDKNARIVEQLNTSSKISNLTISTKAPYGLKTANINIQTDNLRIINIKPGIVSKNDIKVSNKTTSLKDGNELLFEVDIEITDPGMIQSGNNSVSLVHIVLASDLKGPRFVDVTVNEYEEEKSPGTSRDCLCKRLQYDSNSMHPYIGPEGPANDLDGDGYFEDIDGSGSFDFEDVIQFVFTYDDISENDKRLAFDFTGDGTLDFKDVIELVFSA
jgi:PKD repeat protein